MWDAVHVALSASRAEDVAFQRTGAPGAGGRGTTYRLALMSLAHVVVSLRAWAHAQCAPDRSCARANSPR